MRGDRGPSYYPREPQPSSAAHRVSSAPVRGGDDGTPRGRTHLLRPGQSDGRPNEFHTKRSSPFSAWRPDAPVPHPHEHKKERERAAGTPGAPPRGTARDRIVSWQIQMHTWTHNYRQSMCVCMSSIHLQQRNASLQAANLSDLKKESCACGMRVGELRLIQEISNKVGVLISQLEAMIQSIVGVLGHLTFSDLSPRDALNAMVAYVEPIRALDPRLQDLQEMLLEVRYLDQHRAPEDRWAHPLQRRRRPTKCRATQTSRDDWDSLGVDRRKVTQTDDRPWPFIDLNQVSPRLLLPSPPPEKSDEAVQTEAVQISEGAIRPTPPPPAAKPPARTQMLEALRRKATLEGIQWTIHSAMYKPDVTLVCVCRYDHENREAMRDDSSRRTNPVQPKKVYKTIYSATIEQSVSIRKLPPKVPRVMPHYHADVYDTKGANDSRRWVYLGTAKKSFLDPQTSEANNAWPIMVPGTEKQDGIIYVTLTAIPSEAVLPAAAFLIRTSNVEKPKMFGLLDLVAKNKGAQPKESPGQAPSEEAATQIPQAIPTTTAATSTASSSTSPPTPPSPSPGVAQGGEAEFAQG
ncbi:unnamed protein product [Vitrella brassicaformis CCMP3155]|uniref:Uncharacterized protein n=2 Tax=Vitrella brassicaformis TaxID=1169539 RepID=A0A0G4EJF3_VITBC|nr:unnamed protein product [Vitrella brassicaformis CCMP3155]|eukprot:CEL96591.1 unnamed protein product [Vitrella brassicaformis CCMP3155]